VVETEHDGIEVVRELFGVEVPSESALGYPDPENDRDHLQPPLLERDEAVADWTRSVVELRRRRDEETSPRNRVRFCPGQPPLEEGSDAGLAAGLAHGGLDDLFDEALGGRVEHLDLEGLLGPEVSEEAALGEAQVGREAADGQPFQSDLGRESDALIEDRRPRGVSLGHERIRARTFVLCQDLDMEAFSRLIGLTGRWRGTYRLIVEPDQPARDSESTAVVAPVAGGRFARIDCGWEFEGNPQEGSILFGSDRERGVVTALWVDSWHTINKVMSCEGVAGASLDLLGSYAAPPGPNWGWRTVIDTPEPDSFRMVMYNISPAGKEHLAVDAVYRRAD